MTCYGCEVWLIKTEEQRKVLALEMDYLRSARVSSLQKSQIPPLKANCKQNNNFRHNSKKETEMVWTPFQNGR